MLIAVSFGFALFLAILFVQSHSYSNSRNQLYSHRCSLRKSLPSLNCLNSCYGVGHFSSNSNYRRVLELVQTSRLITRKHAELHSINTDSSNNGENGNSSSIVNIGNPSALTAIPDIESCTSSFFTSVTNLVKNTVGAGVFSLNFRVAKVALEASQFKRVIILIYSMATWAAFNFYVVGETCKNTNSSSFAEAWGKTVGESTRKYVQLILNCAPIVACLANTIVLHDVTQLVLSNLGVWSSISNSRIAVISILSTFVLFPICSLKDLSALKSISTFGLSGQLIAMSVILKRIQDKSYFIGGKYYKPVVSVAEKAVSAVDNSQWFVIASILSYCLLSHYNSPRYYTELKPITKQRDLDEKNKDLNSDQKQKLKQKPFFRMAALSYFISSSIYLVTVKLCLTLFGAHSASFALNSLRIEDPLALLAFAAFGSSVLASYPLIFLSIRTWFITKASTSPNKFLQSLASTKTMTAILLTAIGYLGIIFTDIGKVGSLSGAFLGSAMIFIFPPLMYLNYLLKSDKRDEAVVNGSKPRFRNLQIAVNVLSLIGGGCFATGNAYNSITNIFKA